MLDAPVSGGVPAASDGTLTFIVGGTEEGIERARPLLMSMGTKVLYCGGAGSGCIAKVGGLFLVLGDLFPSFPLHEKKNKKEKKQHQLARYYSY